MSRVGDIVDPSRMSVADLVTDLGLTEHDAREVRAFGRFLEEAGPPGARLRTAPGWLPYALGVGPWPDEGYGATPVTAWTVPS